MDQSITKAPPDIAQKRQRKSNSGGTDGVNLASSGGDRRKSLAANRVSSRAALATDAVGKENLKSTLSMGGRQQKKVVAVIGEETQESFKKRFLTKQVDGAVKLETFFDILADMQEVYDVDGVVYNAGLVHKMYQGAGDDDNDAMTQRDCLVLIGRFISKCQEHDRRLVAEAAARKAAEAGAVADTQYVSWWPYFKSRLTCRPKKKGAPTLYWVGITRIDEQTSLFVLAVIALMFTCCLVIGIEANSAFTEIRDDAEDAVRGVAVVLDAFESSFSDSTLQAYRRIIDGLSTKLNPATSALVDSSIQLYLKLGLARTYATLAGANNVALAATETSLLTLSEPLSFVATLSVAFGPTSDDVTTTIFDSVLHRWVQQSPTDRSFILAYLGGIGGTVIVGVAPNFEALSVASQQRAVADAYAATNGTLSNSALLRVGTSGTLYLAVCESYGSGDLASRIPAAFGLLVACTYTPRTVVNAAITAKLAYYEITLAGSPACRVAMLDRMVPGSTWQFVNATWSPVGSLIKAPNVSSEFVNAAAAIGADKATSNVWPAMLATPFEHPFERWVYGAQTTRFLDYLAVTYLPTQGLSLMGVCAVNDTVPPDRFTSGAAVALEGTQATITNLRAPTLANLQRGQTGAVVSNGVSISTVVYPFSSQEVLGAYAKNGTSQTVYPVEDPVDGTTAVAGYFSAPKLNNASFTVRLPEYDTAIVTDTAIERMFEAVVNEASSSSLTVLILVDTPDGKLNFSTRPASCPDKPITSCTIQDGAHKTFYSRRDSSTVHDEMGDDGNRYRTAYRYSTERNAIVGVATRLDATEKLGWMYTGFIMLIGGFFLVVVSLLVRQVAGNVLDRIRDEYLVYKAQIENEKVQFSELVKDVMPAFIQARVLSGEQLIVDQHPQLTFLFSDIVGCGELTRNSSVVEMVRLLGYTFMLQDNVAEYYHIHKLKTIGDAFFCVAGLEDVARKKELEELKKKLRASGASDAAISEAVAQHEAVNKLDSQVLRMVSFAVVVQQLLGVEYVHHPERTECFLESAGSDLGKMNMPSMQMGIHCGNAIAGVVDVGRAPHFDCFGPSVNLSSRMETTAPVDRLQISAPTYEILKHVDKDHEFEFDPPKKTLIKGYGTMNTFTIRSTTLRVPEEIIQRLRCERAIRLRHFTEAGITIGTDPPQTDDGSILQPSTSSRHEDFESILH